MTIIAGAFDCTGLTPPQLALIESAARRSRYDPTRCLLALRGQWGKPAINVVFSDLSRFSAGARAAGDGHTHDDVHVNDPETGAVGHGIQHRHRVLGLAWSNGKIEIDASLENQSELAQEVFLSELAHQVDWFDPAMDAAGEERIWDAMHPGVDSTTGDHGHSWFDVGAYETWAGEAWMGLFTAAASDVAVSLTQFTHKITPEAINMARRVLDIDVPAPDVDVDVTVPTYFATKRGSTFHDAHKGVTAARTYATRSLAVAAGLKPCGVCKP